MHKDCVSLFMVIGYALLPLGKRETCSLSLRLKVHADRPFSPEDWNYVSVWCLGSALVVVACQELSFQLLQSHGALKFQPSSL